MKQRPVVLLLIPHLGGGGAERVFELLLQNLSPSKYDLHLGLVTATSISSAQIPQHVTVHCLGRRRVRTAALQLLRLVRHLRPTLILSNMAHLNFLVLLLRPVFPPATRILIRQNGTVTAMLHDSRTAWRTRLLYRALYPLTDRVICQSRAMADDLIRQTGISPNRLVVLHNPVETPQTFSPSQSILGPRLLAAGRLSREKGIDLLLEAIALLLPRFPTLQLSVAGRGPEESALRRQSVQLGLDDVVHFLGHQDSLEPHFDSADLFVLPSRHEGMPNALLEAAASGLPVVATPACGGILEILEGSQGTWLTRDVTAASIAESIEQALITLPHSTRVCHTWLHRFRLENAIPAYEDLIDSLCGKVASAESSGTGKKSQ